jgi:hypothetical protein
MMQIKRFHIANSSWLESEAWILLFADDDQQYKYFFQENLSVLNLLFASMRIAWLNVAAIQYTCFHF